MMHFSFIISHFRDNNQAFKKEFLLHEALFHYRFSFNAQSASVSSRENLKQKHISKCPQCPLAIKKDITKLLFKLRPLSILLFFFEFHVRI